MYSKKDTIQKVKGKSIRAIAYITLITFLFSISSQAQCAMCRAALEGEGNTKKAAAVNDGIVYLMIIPYVLVATIGFIIYRMYQKKRQ